MIPSPRPTFGPRRRRGFSLIELMVVLVVVGIMVALAVPSYQVALEQSRADIAVANLRAVWAAQRLYWLENRTYADIGSLQSAGMLPGDINISDTAKDYIYAVSAGYSASAFSATADRQNGHGWSGTFAIDQDGKVTGSIDNGSRYVYPPYMYR